MLDIDKSEAKAIDDLKEALAIYQEKESCHYQIDK